MMKRLVNLIGVSFAALLVMFLLLLTVMTGTSAGEAAPVHQLEEAATVRVLEEDPFSLAYAQEQLFISLYDRVSPSVVHIAVTGSSGSGSGSGFVWDGEGHIVTNNHVVENADRIQVRFADDTTVEAEVVGADPDSDLAVIQVDAPAELLQPVDLGNSDALRVGQMAIAIGNPFGLEQTMTTGIVSALGRVVRQESGFSLPKLVQTDAAINPGNSGGPLLDSQGLVIGVTTLIYSESGGNSGVGFAVPVNTVKRVVPALISTGAFADPWLGITGTSIEPALAQELDLPIERGVLVQSVIPGGPSDLAGVLGGDRQAGVEGAIVALGGDLVTAIDGIEVGEMDDIINYLSEASVGQDVVLKVLRDGQPLTLIVTLGARPSN